MGHLHTSPPAICRHIAVAVAANLSLDWNSSPARSLVISAPVAPSTATHPEHTPEQGTADSRITILVLAFLYLHPYVTQLPNHIDKSHTYSAEIDRSITRAYNTDS